MKVTTKNPKIEYPYLAVWVGVDGELNLSELKATDISLISLLDDKRVQVQFLLGCGEAFITKNESEYAALPIGYTVEIVQSTQK